MKRENINRFAKNVKWFSFKNKKGEDVKIEMTRVYTDPKDKKSLPNLWKKHGYTKKNLTNYLCVDTFVTDKEGNCTRKYNPQADKKNPGKINFNYMLEATEANEEKLLKKVVDLAGGEKEIKRRKAKGKEK